MPKVLGHSGYEDGKHVAISVQWLDAVNNAGWNLEHVERSQRVWCPAHGDDYPAMEHDEKLIRRVPVCLHGKLPGVPRPAFQHLKSVVGASEELP